MHGKIHEKQFSINSIILLQHLNAWLVNYEEAQTKAGGETVKLKTRRC